MSKRAKIIIAVILVLIVAAVALYFIFGRSATAEVDTAQVESKKLVTTVNGSGSLIASNRRNVEVPTASTLTEIYVKDGQEVAQGQVIAKIDPASLEAQVAQAEAGLAQAQSARSQLTNAVSSSDVQSAQNAYETATSTYDLAKQALASLKELQKNPVEGVPAPTADDIQTAQKAVDQASAAQQQAKAALAKVKNPIPADSMAAANLAVSSAQTTVDIAKANLEKAAIKAPMAGVIFFNPISATASAAINPSSATATVGSMVSPGAPPFTIVDPSTLVFEADVDEADINGIATEMGATVTLDAFGNESFEGTVTVVAKQSTTTTTGGTVFPVQISLKVPKDTKLLTGMKGDATIKTETKEAPTTIPLDALFEENNETYVYCLKDDTAVKTTIKIGLTTNNDVEVLEGLKTGQTVILPGDTTMTDGMKVKTKNSSNSGS